MFLLRLKSILLAAVVLLWLLVVIAGMRGLTRYAHHPGNRGQPLAQWPLNSTLLLSDDAPTLVMFAHPRCPCTRASVDELSVLMARCQGALKAKVVFYQPADGPANWSHTDLWSAAAMIPGVEVVVDRAGEELRRFGAATSGHTFLYDCQGHLLFEGGITSARGHVGDNLGRSSIVTLLDLGRRDAGKLTRLTTTPVFGCPVSD